MEKIRIAFVISSLEIGGAERVFLNLVQALDDKKYIKKVFILKKNYNTPFDLELQKSGIDYVYINKKTRLFFDLFAHRRLFKELCQFSPHIIHSHLKVTNYLIKYKLYNKKTKWIHTHHTDVSSEIYLFRKLIMKYLYAKHLILPICVSKAVKESFLETFKLTNIDIKVIYNGINIDEFYYSRKEMNNDRLIITHVGRFAKVKNHRYLIKEFAKFFRTHQMTHLNLIGEGKEREKIQKLVNSYGLQNVVTFYNSNVDVFQILKKSDIFVLSSFYEGNSLSILEAMASGCVVLASDVEGNGEIIENGVNGYLFKLRPNRLFEKLVYLNNRRALIFSLSQNNNYKVQEYSINKMKLAYEEVYIDYE
ncbi:MAG: glycosyltransferase [Acholeplasmataceae bacterium]|nr:glycosyltransferase [Acholeplasmataceae bacterium]